MLEVYKDILHINSNNNMIPQVDIFTMTGQKIYSETGHAIQTIYIFDFPAGLQYSNNIFT